MTTIVGAIDRSGGIAIAGDSLISSSIFYVSTTPKIRQFGALVAGFTGNADSHNFVGRAKYATYEIEEFANDFRQWQIDRGHHETSNTMRSTGSAAVVVGVEPPDLRAVADVYTPRLWMLGCDGSVLTFDRYTAVGSGMEIAHGVLSALFAIHPEIEAWKAVLMAVDAAADHDRYTGGPVTIWSWSRTAHEFVRNFDESCRRQIRDQFPSYRLPSPS